MNHAIRRLPFRDDRIYEVKFHSIAFMNTNLFGNEDNRLAAKEVRLYPETISWFDMASNTLLNFEASVISNADGAVTLGT